MALDERTAITFTPGVAPICSTLVKYFEEPGLGLSPRPRPRFRTTLHVLTVSAALLIAAVFVAMAVSGKGQEPAAIQQPPVMRDVHLQRHRGAR